MFQGPMIMTWAAAAEAESPDRGPGAPEPGGRGGRRSDPQGPPIGDSGRSPCSDLPGFPKVGTVNARSDPLVLVVDDHADLCAALDVLLTGHGFSVVHASDGERALEVARTAAPDAVLLDVQLPGLNGTEVCRRLRTFTDAPVLFLTGATDVTDQLVGFAAGADDYIPKPFHPPLLVARLQAHLRRRRDPGFDPVVRSGSLAVDLVARRVTVGEAELNLTRTEYTILEFLAEAADRIVSREELVDAVWDGWCGDDHVIDVNLSRLRQKLRQAGGPEAVITTHRGRGLRWNTRSGETRP